MDDRSVIRSAGTVGLFTMCSRVLGLTRDVLMAGFFGTSLAMSSFVVAFTIPNLFRRLFGEGALSAAFVPVFVEARRTEGDGRAWDLARRIITLVGLVLIAICVVGIFLAAAWQAASPDMLPKTAMTLQLLRIMLPYMFFICLVALCMAILNSFHHFAVPASTPLFLNVIWICTVVFVCPKVGSTPEEQIVAVAWGILFAGLVQLLLQVPVLWRYGYRPGISFDFRDRRVTTVLRLMVPAAMGLAVTQVNVMIDRLLAIWIGAWAPAALFYSERLIYFPLGIFATAFSTVLLPVFSGHAADGDSGELKRTLNHSLRNLLFLMIPASVGLLVLARPIVQMIFEWRSFGSTSTDLTTVALQFYAPGLLVFSAVKVFVPAFYAQQDTRTPVRIGLWAVAMNLALNITFVLTWPYEMKHAGLACATVISEGFQCIMLGLLLHRRHGSPGWRQIGRSALLCLCMAAVMALVIHVAHGRIGAWLGADGVFGKFDQVVAVFSTIACGMLAYFTCALLCRCEEARDITKAFVRRINR